MPIFRELQRWEKRAPRQKLAIVLWAVHVLVIIVVALASFETESIVIGWPILALSGFVFVLATWPMKSAETLAFGLSAPVATAAGAMLIGILNFRHTQDTLVVALIALIVGYAIFAVSWLAPEAIRKILRWHSSFREPAATRWQFSMRTLLALMTVTAVLLAVVVEIVRLTKGDTVSELRIYAAFNLALCALAVDQFIQLRRLR